MLFLIKEFIEEKLLAQANKLFFERMTFTIAIFAFDMTFEFKGLIFQFVFEYIFKLLSNQYIRNLKLK